MFAIRPDTMRAHAPSPTLALALLLVSFATTAHAQSYLPTLIEIDGKTYNDVADPPISKAQCDAQAKLTFRVTGLPGSSSNPSYLQVWAGSACNTDTRRSTDTGKACTLIADMQPQSSAIEVPRFNIGADKFCETEGNRTLFFLGVNSLDDSLDVGNAYGVMTLPVDKTSPSAPKKVTGGSGETEIPIRWKAADEDVDHYVLVWDPAASSDPSGTAGTGATDDDAGAAPAGPGECSSRVLMAGDELPADPDDLPGDLRGKRIDGKVSSAKISGSTLGSELVAVGVIAVDLAGNPSLVSNIACLSVVPTTGFFDRYRQNGGQVEEGCTCSLPGTGANAANAWPVALALFALCARARTRTRKKRQS